MQNMIKTYYISHLNLYSANVEFIGEDFFAYYCGALHITCPLSFNLNTCYSIQRIPRLIMTFFNTACNIIGNFDRFYLDLFQHR